MRDIATALRWIARESQRRDKTIQHLRAKGWRTVKIANKLGISRQRVLQIEERLKDGSKR